MSSYKFTRCQRLLTVKEYQWVFDNSVKKIHSEHFLLVIASPLTKPSCSPHFDGNARLGLAVTKKKLKKAVDRNYIKRIARESFRQIQIPPFFVDCVLLVKKSPLSHHRLTTSKSKSIAIQELGLYDEISTLFAKIERLNNNKL